MYQPDGSWPADIGERVSGLQAEAGEDGLEISDVDPDI